ncbi:hypothetical protein MPLA_650012 [Mesorhizobium sp. ORS 3359]|nr:hypothetical protein MPLA_650012 [Mesorhizobium sp. ORS 3359]
MRSASIRSRTARSAKSASTTEAGYLHAAAGLRPLPRQASNRLRKLVGRFAPVAETIKMRAHRKALAKLAVRA